MDIGLRGCSGSEDIVIEVRIASAYRSRMKIADLSDKRELRF